MHAVGSKFSSQIWRRGVDGHQFGWVHVSDSQLRPIKLCLIYFLVVYYTNWIILTWESMEAQADLMERSLLNPKLKMFIRCTDIQPQTRECAALWPTVYLGSLVISLIMSGEPMDTHSWYKLELALLMRGVHRAQSYGCAYDWRTTTSQ